MAFIQVSEVGLRDGLQNVAGFMPLAAKQAWVRAAYEAGVREIEVGSFVSPKVIPQMRETAEVVAFAKTLPELTVAVLVPNLKGAELAVAAGVDKIGVPLSASEPHSLKNVNRSHAQMLDEIKNIKTLLDGVAPKTRPAFDVGLATAFGCSIVGAIKLDDVVRLAQACIQAGADEICLSDTTGYAHPTHIKQAVRAVKKAIGDERMRSLHLHNTRGLGLANALAGLEEGITVLDSSLGGLGGCPTAPGASGNIVTEDLVFMLQSMGYETGIDVAALLAMRTIIADALPDEPLYGFLALAGLPKNFQTQNS